MAKAQSSLTRLFYSVILTQHGSQTANRAGLFSAAPSGLSKGTSVPLGENQKKGGARHVAQLKGGAEGRRGAADVGKAGEWRGLEI